MAKQSLIIKEENKKKNITNYNKRRNMKLMLQDISIEKFQAKIDEMYNSFSPNMNRHCLYDLHKAVNEISYDMIRIHSGIDEGKEPTDLENVFYTMDFGKVIAEPLPRKFKEWMEWIGEEQERDCLFLVNELYNHRLDSEIAEAWETNKDQLDGVALYEFYDVLHGFIYEWFENLNQISKHGRQVGLIHFCLNDGLFTFHNNIMWDITDEYWENDVVREINQAWIDGDNW